MNIEEDEKDQNKKRDGWIQLLDMRVDGVCCICFTQMTKVVQPI